MSLTVTELADEVRDMNRRLTDAVQKRADSVQRLEVRTADIADRLGSIRKIGWTVAMTAIGLLGSAFYVVHRAAQIEDAVVALQKDSSQIKVAVVTLEKDFGRIEGAVVGLQKDCAEMRNDSRARDGGLDRALDSLDRIEKTLAQTSPAKSGLK